MYDTLPVNATLKPSKFEAHVPDEQLSDFKTLLRLSPVGPKTYENTTRTDGQYGIGRQWLIETKDYWQNEYDWRTTEDRINSFPNFTVPVKARDGDTYPMHFVALFSESPEAVPICLLHGWPGSFLEFLKLLDEVKSKYTPKELPYHFIVPSLPGYTFSTGPSVKDEWNHDDISYVINELMVGLGFGSGYMAHGGDIGSFISRILAVRYSACKAIHLNFCLMPSEPQGIEPASVTASEKANLSRLVDFGTYGDAYAKEHGTKGGTIGLALSASPLALLSWIGEKYIAWTDTTPSTHEILDSVMLYWLTETFARCIYPYIELFGRGDKSTTFHSHPDYYCGKPIGYSYFPFELGPIPLAWAKTTGNIVWHREHKAVSLFLPTLLHLLHSHAPSLYVLPYFDQHPTDA